MLLLFWKKKKVFSLHITLIFLLLYFFIFVYFYKTILYIISFCIMKVLIKSKQSLQKKLFLRQSYIDKIKTLSRKENILIVKWQRRVGKSSVIIWFLQSLWIDTKVIFYINKEYDEYDELKNSEDLSLCFDTFVQKNGEPLYIVVDEIQDIQGWEKFIRSKNALGNYYIIISWSNSSLLSGEFATFLTGRHSDLSVYPLSYAEYLQMKWEINDTNNFFQYIEFGWLPEILAVSDHDAKKNYIRSVLSDIVLKDIVARYKIKDISILYKILEYFSSITGKISSLRNIANYFQQEEKIDIAVSTISRYISYLLLPYLIHKVPRYDLVGKEILEYKDKYFFNDLGIKNSIRYDVSKDISWLLENLVYIHSKRLWYEVYVGEMKGKEIDFVLLKWNEKIYIQVAYYVIDEATRQREFWNLLQIHDNYKKIVLSLDEVPHSNSDGIERVNIRSFLLQDRI